MTEPTTKAALALLDANEPRNATEEPDRWAAYFTLRNRLAAIEAEAVAAFAAKLRAKLVDEAPAWSPHPDIHAKVPVDPVWGQRLVAVADIRALIDQGGPA